MKQLFLLLGFFVFSSAIAADNVVITGKVQRALSKKAVSQGIAELRLPGRESEFATVTAPLKTDGTFALHLPFAAIPKDPQQLTVSILAEGFEIVEKPLAIRPGSGVPETIMMDFTLSTSSLNGILDIFSCCVLSFSILTVMLPAFLLGAAITAFVPSQGLLKYLGPQAPKPVAYGAAISSGMVLSLCSCNVVPLFVSIWAGGAGTGPAFAFLYAGPAINLVATVFTCRVIGVGIGVFRVLSVALSSLIVGLLMARIFGERKRVDRPEMNLPSLGPSGRVVGALLMLLFYLLIIGSFEFKLPVRLLLSLPAGIALVLLSIFGLGRDYIGLWLRETGSLAKKVFPILIPSVFALGFLAQKIPLSTVASLQGANSFLHCLGGSIFGSLMYFPILTETPFVKTMLLLGIGIGPGMALLLTAPGLSLPGMVIVGREIGWKRLLVYVISIVLFATLAGVFFSSEWGAYICSCQLE